MTLDIKFHKELKSLDQTPLREELLGRIKDFLVEHKLEPDATPDADSIEKARKFMGDLLQEVLKLEFSTVPLYLNAAYSLVQKHNQIFKLLVRIGVEEMSHMTVIANLMVAIGVQPKFTGEHAPKFPGPIPLVKEPDEYQPGSMDKDNGSLIANLRSFRGTKYPVTPEEEAEKINKDVLNFFLRIELPEFEEEEHLAAESIPETPEPATIGELYEWLVNIFEDPEYPAIAALLKDACQRTDKQLLLKQIPIKGRNDMRYHPVRLFPGKGAKDYTFSKYDCQGDFDLVIDSVDTAQQYLRWVAGEGEGASMENPWAPSGLAAHYFRFNSTLKGKQLVPKEGGGAEYAGNDLIWELDKICTFDDNPKPDDLNYSAKTRELMKEFDEKYSKMLWDLEHTYREEDKDKKMEYYTRATRVWMKEMGMAARRLMRHMMEENKPLGQRGGLSFKFIPEAKPDRLS